MGIFRRMAARLARHPHHIGCGGRRAERRAARYLSRRGYRIIARNLRAGGGEIDLLTRFGPLLVVVEVRARRAGILSADRATSPKKARLVRQTFRALRQRHAIPHSQAVRFDLLLTDGRGGWAHFPGALDDAPLDCGLI